MTDADDSPYRRLNYRRLIAWPARIEREWPLIEREVRQAPEPSVIDLGAGTGEHVRHLAAQGIRAVGVDRSEDQVAQAREYEDPASPFGPVFLHGDLTRLDALTDERFGVALCLGNVVPHLEDDALAQALEALGRCLLPGGRFLLQVLNYERIAARSIRYLPLNFRNEPDGEGEIVFARFLRPDGERHVLFYPTTLVLRPGAEPPVAIEVSHEVRLRAWKRAELEAALATAGFTVAAVHGDMEGNAYSATEASDLVVVATR